MIKECLGTAPENQTDLLVPRDIWFCSPDLIPSIREGKPVLMVALNSWPTEIYLCWFLRFELMVGDIRGAQCFGFKHLQISNHPLIFLELLSDFKGRPSSLWASAPKNVCNCLKEVQLSYQNESYHHTRRSMIYRHPLWKRERFWPRVLALKAASTWRSLDARLQKHCFLSLQISNAMLNRTIVSKLL